MTISGQQGKSHLSRPLKRVVAGEEVVIARGGSRVARLVPIDRAELCRPGLAKGRVTDAFFEPLPADELETWQQ